MTETQKVRVKAKAKLMANGWQGILIIHRGDDVSRKYGISRTSLAEAEQDAVAMLRDFQSAIGRDPLRSLLETVPEGYRDSEEFG